MEEQELRVTLPDALSEVVLPKGWTVVEGEDLLTVLGPEQDLKVAFVAEAAVDDPDGQMLGVWRKLEPGFDAGVRQRVESPAADGWEKVWQIVYETPASERRIAMSMVRLLRGRVYLLLLSGTIDAWSRRMAQVVEMMNAWKPEGLEEPSLAGRTAKPWGDQEQAAMREFIEGAMKKMHVPGTAVAVVQDGRTVWAEGFGVRSVEGSDAVTPETRFMIGSTGKALTSFMMARLVDQGRMRWTTPVRDLLPGFALADADVTSRLEMRHTVCACTGMPRRDTDLIFKFRGVTAEDRIAEMKGMLPTTGFGEVFQYSNYLVAAGGYAAARAHQADGTLAEAYDGAMRELVFAPLGMEATSVLRVDAPEDATPHGFGLHEDAVPVPIVMESFADAVAPAGSVWSTVLDMAQYMRCELAGGKNGTGDRVISEEILQARRKLSIKIDEKRGYGLGLFLTKEQGLAEAGHGGNTLGFTSEMVFMPEQGVGLAILSNLRMANVYHRLIHQRYLELLFDAEPKAAAMLEASAVNLEDDLRRSRERVKADSSSVGWIGELAGEYRCEELGPARIVRDDGGYRVEFESWSSALGVEQQSGEDRLMVLTDAPWQGALRMRIPAGERKLLLDGAQTTFTFLPVA